MATSAAVLLISPLATGGPAWADTPGDSSSPSDDGGTPDTNPPGGTGDTNPGSDSSDTGDTDTGQTSDSDGTTDTNPPGGTGDIDTPPAVSPGEVRIDGKPAVGLSVQVLPGTWTPDAPDTSFTYGWLADDEAIPGATGSSFTITPDLVGEDLTVTVTGSATGYSSAPSTSDPVTVVPGTFSATVPTLSTTKPAVGALLTATTAAWGPTATFSYQWNAAGAPILGAVLASYTPTAAVLGKKITVSVTGVATGYKTATTTSLDSAAVAKGAFTSSTPTIAGDPVAGEQLTASSGTLSPKPTKVSYQWNRDGKAINGATARTYTLTGADYQTKISVTETAQLTGYTDAHATSKPTTKVARPYALLGEDGYYKVSDLGAGTYMSSNSAKAGCYWERRTNAGQGKKGFIASDIGGGQQIVTIAATDKYFYTEACGAWTKFVAIGKPVTTVGNGTYAVNSQLTPGKYRTTTATKSCWWARMSGYLGYSWTGANPKLIATVQNDAKTQTVTVKAGDTGFQTQGCGTWKRVG